MTGLMLALIVGAALSLAAAGLAWLAGLILQARTRHSSPGLWRSARLVAILPLLLAPVLYAVPQTLPALPSLEFLDEPDLALPQALPLRGDLAAEPAALALPRLEIVLAALYVIGLAGALLLALQRHRRRRRLLMHSRIAGRDERVLLEHEADKLGMAAPELRLCASTVTPCLTGWRGVIIAPERLLLTPDLARHALVHELCHLRRGDERDRLIGAALNIIVWFNWPLRQIERELDAAREIACDSAAIEVLGHTQRKAYAAALIETMRSTAQPVSAFGPHNRRQREMRIKAILSGGQSVRYSLLTAGALLLLTIPVACAQTAATPRRVVSAPVDQIVAPAETRQISEAHGDAFVGVIALQDEEDWEAAIASLDPIIADAGSSAYDRAVALQLRGRAYYELDRIDDAIADWRAAIDTGAMAPGEVNNYRTNIAQLLIVNGQYDEAIAAFETLLAEQPTVTPQLNRMLAQAYAQAGRFEEGLPYAEAVYQADPGMRSNQQMMLFYFQQMGMDEQARTLQAQLDTPAAPVAAPAPAATPAEAPIARPQPATTPDLPRVTVPGRVTSAYGPRPAQPAGSPAFHGGIDIAAASGTTIAAPGGGTVIHAAMGYNGSERWGNTVEIDHGDGWSTLYAHLDEIDVEPGQSLAAGQRIGTVGATGVATGPHVHVELHYNGERVDPADYLTGLR